MELRSYCIVVLGDVNNLSSDIKAISEGDVRFVNGKGIFLGVFDSAFNLKELNDFLLDTGKSFILSEITKESFVAFFKDEKHHRHLFGTIPFLEADSFLHMREVERTFKTEEKQDEPELSLNELLDLVGRVGLEKLPPRHRERLDALSKAIK